MDAGAGLTPALPSDEKGGGTAAESTPPERDAYLGVEEFEKIELHPGEATSVVHNFTPKAKTKAWNPDEYTMQTQARLAFRLIWVLVGVLVGGAAIFTTTRWTGLATKDVTDFFGIAFAAVVTLTTAATSFWFGSVRAAKQSNSNSGSHDNPPTS